MERSENFGGKLCRRLTALLAACLLAWAAPPAPAQHEGHGQQSTTPARQSPPKTDNRVVHAPGGVVPVHTPDLSRLPWTTDNGVKVFHLTAEVVEAELLPGYPQDMLMFMDEEAAEPETYGLPARLDGLDDGHDDPRARPPRRTVRRGHAPRPRANHRAAAEAARTQA